MAEPATFVCPVCKQRRGLMKGSQIQYEPQSNGGKICHTCITRRDQEQVKKGKITLTIARIKDDWWAVNRTGKVRYKLMREPGQSDAQVIGSPSFRDQDGHLWQGRLYTASGAAHFQRTKTKVLANGKPKGKKPAAKAKKARAKAKA